MAESAAAKEAREAWESARAEMDASGTPAAREAERLAWRAYMNVADPSGTDAEEA